MLRPRTLVEPIATPDSPAFDPSRPRMLGETVPLEATLISNREVLEAGADRIVAARVLTVLSRNIKEGRVGAPLIEIKGLGSSVADIRKMMETARTEAAGLSQDGQKLVTAIQDVRTQINQHFADLKFEAEQLGNGSATSGPSGGQ